MDRRKNLNNIHLSTIGLGMLSISDLSDLNRQNVDFIIQLGDFCVPSEQNLRFMDIWHQFRGLSYHVIGNHNGWPMISKTHLFWL